ncbi:MAG: plastocyanin/azurin family copper-binding protein [Balneolaceae bacterium]
MNPSPLKPYFLFLTALLLAFTMISCGDSTTDSGVNGGNGNDNGNGTEEPAPNEVSMVGESFSPSTLEVEVGTTVTWENQSDLIHTVTSGSDRTADGLFDSGNLSEGQTFSYTFDEVGTFDYFCIPHEGMTGTITVVEASDEQDGY